MLQVPDLDHFDYDDAWEVGRNLTEKCRADNLPVTVSIWLGEQRVFHSALRGSSADNDSWVERKARTVRRFGCASLKMFERCSSQSVNFFETFALSPERYSPAGGGVPIMVKGSLVGVVAISGLDMVQDHDLAAAALTN